MVYKVIGLMSGSSLDGLDIVYVQLEEVRGNWSFELLQAECIPYNEQWTSDLKHAATMHVPDYLKLHTRYGRYLGECVQAFMTRHDLEHKVHFVASHGHTVFHEPANATTSQVGDGAALAAAVGLPVISDLRAMDVALGGQGAPIVPIGDRMLFGNYDYLLNIGGIANVTIRQGESMQAFDVCPANQVLNTLARRMGHDMDEGGSIAATGHLLQDVLERLEQEPYYSQLPPKSLSNEAAIAMAFPALLESEHSVPDLLSTATTLIARQVVAAVASHQADGQHRNILVTGGGAFNTHLVAQLTSLLNNHNVSVIVPSPEVIKYKEALVMALIGTLRWREDVNVLASVTGASRDSVGGALWIA